MTKFSSADIPDLSSKVYVVTGGNSGIGLAAVTELASKGAKVYIASRSEERIQNAISKIKTTYPDSHVKPLIVDFANVRQSVQVAESFVKMEPELDGLILNAGLVSTPKLFTLDGVEETFTVNYLSQFAFSQKLWVSLERRASHSGADVRVVITGSDSYLNARPLDYNEISVEPKNHRGGIRDVWALFTRYGRSKLAIMLYGHQLAKKVADMGIDNIYVNIINPGAVYTNIFWAGKGVVGWLIYPVSWMLRLFAKSPEKAALPLLYAATSPEIREKNIKDRYIGVPANDETEAMKSIARDTDTASGLWEWSEKTVSRICG